jgi:beta propeller repeat protein
MKINKKLNPLALKLSVLVLFLILFSFTVSAATEQNASLTINKTQITTSGSAAVPSIYGDRIVWEDWRNGNRDDGPFNIYMYNISTHKETQITTSESAVSPAIYGDRIVWLDGRNGNSQNDTEGGHDVYMYDLSTHKETRITSRTIPADGFGYDLGIAISGNRILWGGTYDYCIYDIYTQKETQIDDVPIINPAFFGNIIVGVSDIDGRPSNLTMYDLSTHKKTQITTSNAAFSPDIDNNIIVWADERNGYEDHYSEIYMYNLSTKKETQITNSRSTFYYSPAVSKDRILWEDYNNGSIYMYNLSTQEETHTNSTSVSGGFDFYGDKVVWTDWGNEKTNVYMGTLISSKLPIAAFSASPISGKAPLTVAFTDTSTGTPKKWKWDFGDGTTSTKQNPTHKYSKAGVYTIKLTVTNAAGSNTVTKSNYITVTAKPVAAFSASPTSGKSPLNVKFTDKSTGSPKKWKWDLGDGTKSFLQNPTHKYTKAGKYTVTLAVTNAAGINTVTKSNYITVTGTSQVPTADFWGWPLSGKAPLKVTFTETSTGSPTSWKWDFGDGKSSIEKSPTHTYSAAGTYTVKLTAINAAGSSTKTKWNYIKVAK